MRTPTETCLVVSLSLRYQGIYRAAEAVLWRTEDRAGLLAWVSEQVTASYSWFVGMARANGIRKARGIYLADVAMKHAEISVANYPTWSDEKGKYDGGAWVWSESGSGRSVLRRRDVSKPARPAV